VRLAALDLMVISEGGSGGFWLDPGIPGFPCFHLNSRVLTFLTKFIIPCKLRRIRVLGAHRIHA